MKQRITLASIFCALSLTSLMAATSTTPDDAWSIPVYEQTLAIEGDHVDVSIAPVYNGKSWAFTARWDDNSPNNLNMRDAMAELGLKGTFYLNKSTTTAGAAYARELSTKGCSIGGHTLSHHRLEDLNANCLFEELLLNRIEREAETDIPINSFAFPFGNHGDPHDRTAYARISEAWLRSGYLHNVYPYFINRNPHLPEGYGSTSSQIASGDREINGEKFHGAMAKLLVDPKTRETSNAISIGIHARQNAEQLAKFKEVVSTYANRDDFWYCNQTEWAAYAFAASHTSIEPKSGMPGQFTVTRPKPRFTGNDIPLTLILHGPMPKQVQLDGEQLALTSNGEGSWLVNLPSPSAFTTPKQIDWIAGGPGAHNPETAPLFPGLDFQLTPTPDQGWNLTLTNNSDAPLTNLAITLRLPLAYVNGLRLMKLQSLVPGESRTLNFEPGQLQLDEAYWGGRVFAAAEIDFVLQSKIGRLYVVYQGAPNQAVQSGIRDAMHFAGPFSIEQNIFTKLTQLSDPNSPLNPINSSALGQWRSSAASMREIYNANRVIVYAGDAAFQQQAQVFNYKPSLLILAGDFRVEEASLLTLISDPELVFAAMDGKSLDLSSPIKISAGLHRIILVLEKRMNYKVPTPVYAALKSSDTAVVWHPPVPTASDD